MGCGALFRHAKLCRPLASTIAPQMHVCGWHTIIIFLIFFKFIYFLLLLLLFFY